MTEPNTEAANTTPSRTSNDSDAILPGPEICGTGLCAQAQADGVPCTELGRDCQICEHADLPSDAEAW